jgi:hypothetical protein
MPQNIHELKIRIRVVSVIQYCPGYGPDDRGCISDRGNDGIFSLPHHVQTGSGAHPASYPMGTGDSYSGGKVSGVCDTGTTLPLPYSLVL